MYYNIYKITYQTPETTYEDEIIGTDLQDAINHENYWRKPGERLAEDYKVIAFEQTGITEECPYDVEDVLRYAFNNKERVITLVKDLEVNSYDKDDLIEMIEAEDQYRFWHLATLVRDHFYFAVRRHLGIEPRSDN